MKNKESLYNKGIDLQLFAGEEAAEEENTTQSTESTEENDETKVEKTYTKEEMNKIFAKRIAKEKAKAELDKQEAEKLAKMSEAERQQALFNKQKEEFEAQRKEFSRQQMELQVTKELSTKKLPLEFVNYLVGETAEQSMENIKVFEKQFNDSLEKMVQERLKGGYVPPTSQGVKGKYTIEDFGNMDSIDEINKNWGK